MLLECWGLIDRHPVLCRMGHARAREIRVQALIDVAAAGFLPPSYYQNAGTVDVSVGPSPGSCAGELCTQLHLSARPVQAVCDPVGRSTLVRWCTRVAGAWLAEHVDLRDALHRGRADPASVRALAHTLRERIAASGRAEPVPVLTERARARLEAEAAKADAIAEQEREAGLLARLQAKHARKSPAAAALSNAEPSCNGLQVEASLVAVQS